MNDLQTLPKAVTDYIDASNDKDSDKLVALFTDNAIVIDEGKTYKGLDEIAAWQKHAHEYDFHVEVLSAEEGGQEITLTVELTGNFPGENPLKMKHIFTLNGDKIQQVIHE